MATSHPSTVMSGADARSRKRYGGFASLLENSCRSATDPITVSFLAAFSMSPMDGGHRARMFSRVRFDALTNEEDSR